MMGQWVFGIKLKITVLSVVFVSLLKSPGSIQRVIFLVL